MSDKFYMAKKINGGIIVSYVYVVLNATIGMVFVPYLINKLGTENYGIYEMIMAIASNISILNFGLGDTTVKYIAKYRGENDIENQGKVLGITVFFLSVLSIVAFAICGLIYINFDSIYSKSLDNEQLILAKRLFVIAAANVVISLVGGTYANVITAYEKFVFSRGIEIIKLLLRVLLVVFLFHFTSNVVLLLLIDLILSCAVILINFIYSRFILNIKIRIDLGDKELVREILTFSGYTLFFIIAREVLFQTDKTIIGIEMSAIAVTVYSVGNKISSMFNQFGYILSNMYLPRAMMIKECTNDIKQKNLLYFQYMVEMGRKILFIIMVIFGGYILIGADFINLWVGEGYYTSFVSSIIMIIAFFLPILLDSGMAILKAENEQRNIAYAWLLSALANVILTWIAVPSFGILGASIMTLVTSYGINCVVLCIELKRKIEFDFSSFLRDLFHGMLPIVLIIIVFKVIKIFVYIPSNNWLSLIIQGSIFTIIYLACSYVFYFSDEQKKKIISHIIKK